MFGSGGTVGAFGGLNMAAKASCLPFAVRIATYASQTPLAVVYAVTLVL